jgi:xylulokinase
MSYTLGLDIGTSGAKALVADEAGRVLATATAEYPLSQPQPLWSEQEPAHWWRAARQALREVVAQSRVAAEQIVGLGLTGQMHGATFLDAADQVIRPAILWNDQRTADACAEISERVGAERLIALTGNPALTGFQAPKIVWLRHAEPAAYARIARVLLPKDYIRLLLTGEAATDASDAAGTLLLDLRSRDYSQPILDALQIPRAWLPAVYEGPEVTGRLRPEIGAELGLPAGLPVVAGGGDNAAAAVGTGVTRAGVISSSIGTSGVLFAHSDGPLLDPGGRLHGFCHAVPSAYHLMAVALSAGGALQWLRNSLRAVAPDLSYVQLVALAEAIPPGAEGLLFVPYLSGERTPHLDPLARGAWIGLTSRHGLGHLARALMEGVIFALRDGLELMRALNVPVHEIRATGGGGSHPFWRQLQADIYGTAVSSLAAEEGPAYGAALLAGVGVGLFADVAEAVAQGVRVTGSTEPDRERMRQYDELYSAYTELYPALKSSMHRLAATN